MDNFNNEPKQKPRLSTAQRELKKRQHMRMMKRRRRNVLIIFIVSIIFINGIFSLFFKHNAYEILVDNESIGFITNKNVVTADVTKTAQAYIEKNYNTSIEIQSKIEYVEIKNNDIVTIDYMIPEISKNIVYKINAGAISINDEVICILQNIEEAEELLTSTKKELLPDNIKDDENIQIEFLENVTINEAYVTPDDIISREQGFKKLTDLSDSFEQYIIVAGDSPYKIANLYKMTLEELYEINEGLEGSSLVVGNAVTVKSRVAILSVKTIKTETYVEVVQKTTTYQDDNERATSYKKVIQQGKDGQKEVTVEITHVNGFEQERTIVSENILIEPVEEIIIRGTL